MTDDPIDNIRGAMRTGTREAMMLLASRTSVHGVCDRCGGKGSTWTGAETKPCWYCDGTGSIPSTGRKEGPAPR